MNFIPQQTLENISLIKIVASLWNQHHIRVLVAEFTHSHLFSTVDNEITLIPTITLRRQKWQKIEDQVKEKLAKFTLPTSLKEKMLGYIQPVGLQIMKWMEYHLNHCCLDLDLPNEVCWTPQATIDKKKTAELLVKDVTIDITTRYKLACIYCLEDNIPELWNQIPESEKEFFYSEEDPSKISQSELVVFWGYYIKGEVAKMDNMIRRKQNGRCSYTHLFRSAAESGNKVATEYFLQKLNPREKPLLNLNVALSVVNKRHNREPKITDPPKEYYTEVLCFLLLQTSKEQQIEVFKTHPLPVLCCFLDWPWQNFFVEIAGHLWNFLPEIDYYFVFQSILHKLHIGYIDYNYKKIFRDVWQQIPDTDKNYIINNKGLVYLLDRLFQVQDQENFKFIFKDTTLIDKNKLIFSYEGLYLCKSMINRGNWDLFKFFVQLLISSKDEMIKFKKEIEKFVQTFTGRIYIDKYEKQLFLLLDDFVREYDFFKNVDEADNSSL